MQSHNLSYFFLTKIKLPQDCTIWGCIHKISCKVVLLKQITASSMAAYFRSCEWLRVGCDGPYFCLRLLFVIINFMCPRQSYRDLMARHRCPQNSLINEVAFFSLNRWQVSQPPFTKLMCYIHPDCFSCRPGCWAGTWCSCRGHKATTWS